MIGEYIGGAVVILLVILILAVLASCIKIVPQAQALIVERLGAYIGTCRSDFISSFRSWIAWRAE